MAFLATQNSEARSISRDHACSAVGHQKACSVLQMAETICGALPAKTCPHHLCQRSIALRNLASDLPSHQISIPRSESILVLYLQYLCTFSSDAIFCILSILDFSSCLDALFIDCVVLISGSFFSLVLDLERCPLSQPQQQTKCDST
jgi:hypothetical protein